MKAVTRHIFLCMLIGTMPSCGDDSVSEVDCTKGEARGGVVCSGRGQVCDPKSKQCVDCLTNADCAATGKSICNTTTNTCEACTSNDQCAAIDTTKTTCLSTGACVQCTKDNETTVCGENSCNLHINTCTNTIVGSVDFCRPCLSDSECKKNSDVGELYCIAMNYKDSSYGSFCAAKKPEAPDICARGFPVVAHRTSLSGQESDYCLPQENKTTCSAILKFNDTAGCDTDEDCQGTGVSGDGLCKPVTSMMPTNKRCTYACEEIASGTTQAEKHAACQDGSKCGVGEFCCLNPACS